jgi:hypothetical protein
MRDAIKMMESKMSPESVARSRAMAEQEILTVRLGQLREKLSVQHNGFDNVVCQPSILKLEKRKDIKISTLIEYLDSLGMGLEIKTFPKNNDSAVEEEILLRI